MWRDDADPDPECFGTGSRPNWEAEGGVEEGVEEEGLAAGGNGRREKSKSGIVKVKVKVKVKGKVKVKDGAKVKVKVTVKVEVNRQDDVVRLRF